MRFEWCLLRIGGALGMCALLGGCATSLKTAAFDPADEDRAGVVHVLPYTYYKIETTWRIASCGADGPEIGVKVTAESAEADDATQAYIIDPQSLQTLLSIAAFKAEYVDGQNQLKAVSASVEDRTGPTLVNIASGVAQIAAAGLGLAAPGAPPDAQRPVVRCRAGVPQQIATAKARKAALDDLTEQVDAANADVVSLAARVAALGAAVDRKTKAQYAAALEKLQSLQALQAKAASQLSEALKPITYTEKTEWPLNGEEFASATPRSPPAEALRAWLEPEPFDLTQFPAISFQIERVGGFGRDPAAGTSSIPPKSKGLRYRTPARGRLVVCKAQPCTSANPETVLTKLEGPVAQLGYVNVLPVRTRAFGSTTFTAEYGAGGSLKTAGYEQKSAPLEGAASTFNSVAGSAAPLIRANQPAQKLAAETAALEALKRRRDAEAALSPASAPANQAAIDALAADTALLNAQISNYQARLTLFDLEARLQP